MRKEMERTADRILKTSDEMELSDILEHRIRMYMKEHDYYGDEEDVAEALREFNGYVVNSILPVWLGDQMP